MAHGGKREGSGRPKGSLDRATKEHKRRISDMAKEHGPDALKTLSQVMKDRKATASARVAAAQALLDRGYGKPAQSIEHTGADGGPIEHQVSLDPSKLSDEAIAQVLAASIPDEG